MSRIVFTLASLLVFVSALGNPGRNPEFEGTVGEGAKCKTATDCKTHCCILGECAKSAYSCTAYYQACVRRAKNREDSRKCYADLMWDGFEFFED
jgi:hypothetical protein